MRSLERLFRPKTIAVIGGGSWCRNVLRECRKAGFDGPLWAVHPKHDEIDGFRAVRSVGDLPYVPDAVFVGVNRSITVEVVNELSILGAGGAVCFASGFREAVQELEDGADLQKELIAAAGDMPVLGPNCYGFINALDGAALWPDQHGLNEVSRGVAIISQSSNIALNLTMQARGLPISYLFTVGNQAQTGLSEIGQTLLHDDRVTAIGLHIEGIDSLASFEQFAIKAREVGKPLIVLKVGKSSQAQAAAVSHTASLAGSMAGATALLKRLHIAQVESLPVLLEALKLAHVAGTLPNKSIASMSCSGGEASLIADIALEKGIVFPGLDDGQISSLRDVLGPKVALANPLDYHTYIWGDVDAMGRTFAAMLTDDVALGIVVLDFPRSDRCEPAEWLKVIEAIEAAMTASGKPMAVLSSLSETLPENISEVLLSKGIVPLCGMEEAMSAIAALASIEGTANSLPLKLPVPIQNPSLISEIEAKNALARCGVRIPASSVVSGNTDAVSAAEQIGFPVVVKGLGIAHKTEVGAVALNLSCSEAVKNAADRIPTNDMLVEEMVAGHIAELLIGVVQDPVHGYILTLAAGGVLTELLQDRVSLILPVSATQIENALGELRISKLLSGYRGGVGCDTQAIIDAVMAVQTYVTSNPVEEVEINPLLCGEDFAIAADALIRCGEKHDG